MNDYQVNNANANFEGAAPVENAGNIDAALKLDNQLCFPLYACSREMIKQYKIYLDKLDLTYTQYIAMMVLWESKTVTAKEHADAAVEASGGQRLFTPPPRSVGREKSAGDDHGKGRSPERTGGQHQLPYRSGILADLGRV